MMTLDELKDAMVKYLIDFNEEGVMVANSTVHNTVLNMSDGPLHVNSLQLYMDVLQFVLTKKGHTIVAWPGDWQDKSVDDLAPLII
jgi:hypothetical protein